MPTAAEWGSLAHFTPAEFHRPDRMWFPLLAWLDQVRARYGHELTITSDFRDFVPIGGADDSLHLVGRAVDVRWPATREDRWALIEAVIATAAPDGCGIELGLEPGAPGGPHVHLGLWPTGHPSTLFVT